VIVALISLSQRLEREADSFNLTYITYLTRKRNIGSITIPYINNNKEFYLTSGFTGEFNININELMRVFTEDLMPIELDSRLYWSDSISVKELTAD
jgi:hypothetical protein